MSPIPEIKSLDKGSGKSQTQAAISACIQREINNGRERDEAIAMCHEMARGKTGGSPPEGGS